jgi:hypothetical protein
MNWHYELGGQQLGPVPESELRELYRSGKITGNTLVWREGLPDWQPYSLACPEAPPRLSAAPAGDTCCVECGQTFPPDELVTLNKSLVCARCKPVFLQRMAEGAPTGGAGGIWREGKRLITRSETPFPDRCVKCNAPANGFRLKRVLYWQHPAYYLLLLCNLLILLIVVLIVRKKAILHVGLCEAHRKQRRMAIGVWALGTLAGLILIIVGVINSSGPVWLGGTVILLGALAWGVLKGRIVYASKIDKEYVWVSGVGREFLAVLPER